MFPELQLREGWVSVFCLLLMSLAVAWGIQAAEWAEGLSVLQGTVLVGGLLGIVLAKSRVPGRLSHGLSILAGWTWSAYLTSRALAQATELPWTIGVVELEARLERFFLAIFAGGGTADNYVFVLVLAASLWVMAYFAAWAVFRWQRVWWAVIVCGLAILLNINYALANLTIYLVLYLLAALLLVVRASVAYYEQEWRRNQVGYSPGLVSSFLQAGLAVSVAVILLGWLTPGALASRSLQPVWQKVTEPWRRLQEESARVFRDLNYQNPPPLVAMSERRMWFGGPVNLEDIPVVDVDAASGRYWRVMAFHDYVGDGWVNTDPDTVLLDENEQTLAFPELDLRFEMTQTVTLHQDLGPNEGLVAAGQPLRADIPMRAAVSFVTNEEAVGRTPERSVFPAAPGDPSILYARQPLKAGEQYGVLSSLSGADEESLRQAGTDYPSWVDPRYLQLPDSLPNRVRTLAEELTEGLETPYDKAKAIESYLRKIPYSLQIEGPGLRQDGVDYFLFDVQEGYCDYYASAMVVMLRSTGIPARYVRGYIHTTKEEGVYRVLESDGHAWPEVYFPGYGWIEFEPTGGRPALTRPRNQDPAEPGARPTPIRPDIEMLENMDAETDLRALGGTTQSSLQRLWLRFRVWILAIAGLALVIAGAWAVYAVQRQRRMQGLSAAERVYADLVDWVRRLLGIEPLSHQTPYEYAGVVAENVPQGRRAVEQIAGYYVEERFGGRPVAETHADVAWHEAWAALWRGWVEHRTAALKRFWWRLVPPKSSLE
jgi:transglutaminase-like putative cysteine protease